MRRLLWFVAAPLATIPSRMPEAIAEYRSALRIQPGSAGRTSAWEMACQPRRTASLPPSSDTRSIEAPAG